MRRLLPLLFLPLLAADWPQFRGPERTGISAETGLLKAFPKDGPKVLWKITTLGSGYSAPAVVGDTLYVLGSDADNDQLFALDAKDGATRWKTPIGPAYDNPWGGGPRGTPTVVGDRVYALGGKGGLLCADAKAGKEQWKVDLVADLGGKLKKYAYPEWGYSESPLVDGGCVFVTPGGSKGTMAALNGKTGKTLWRTVDWTDEADYVSPIRHTVGGKPMVVQVTAAHVAGVSPADGSLLWKYAREAKITIPTPVAAGDRVYVTSAYNVGCDLLKLTPKVAGFDVENLYTAETRKVMQNHHGGVVLLNGHVYGHSERGWTCQNLETGKTVWTSPKLGKGSVVYADGRLFLYAESDGTLAVIDATTKGYNERGRWRIAQPSAKPRPPRNSANYWTHPVIANGRLYLRDQESLVCYDLSEGK